MNTTKHTPGPWQTINNTSVTTKHGGWIATTKSDINQGADVANARLIAASPELLKALQDLCSAYRIQQGASTDDHAYKQARAALTKATGGAE